MDNYRIASSVLEAIVRGSLAHDRRVRPHQAAGIARSRNVEVQVDGSRCRVTVSLDAAYGLDLMTLGQEVQAKVSSSLGAMTGLSVEAVDVVFARVHPAPRPA